MKNNEPPLLIDEVQYAPMIFIYLKIYVDKTIINGAFALTGSQTFDLMKNVNETLAGRMAIVELRGLSLREIHIINFSKPFIPSEEYINERKNIYQIIQIFGKLFPEDQCNNYKISQLIGKDIIRHI